MVTIRIGYGILLTNILGLPLQDKKLIFNKLHDYFPYNKEKSLEGEGFIISCPTSNSFDLQIALGFYLNLDDIEHPKKNKKLWQKYLENLPTEVKQLFPEILTLEPRPIVMAGNN
jgi:hypothetical protein